MTLRTSRSPRTYRLNWQQALTSLDAWKYPFGTQLPVDRRVSNGYLLLVVDSSQ